MPAQMLRNQAGRLASSSSMMAARLKLNTLSLFSLTCAALLVKAA